MKHAWIEGGTIRDICPGDPASSYHPDVAVHYTEPVPDEARNGDGWDGATLTPVPVPDSPVAVVPPRILSRVQFKLLLTPQERIALRTSADPGVQDWYEILHDPQFEGVDMGSASTERAMAWLVSKDILTEARKSAILAGDTP